MQAYFLSWKRFADFTGRSSRLEYWLWVLVNIVVSAALVIIEPAGEDPGDIGMLSALFALAVFIPTLALTARRLHDFGQSGWLVLLMFIPLVNFFAWIYFGVKGGDPSVNNYGAPSRFAPGAEV